MPNYDLLKYLKISNDSEYEVDDDSDYEDIINNQK